MYFVRTDLEAVLLEARLIRLHQPKYNSIQKDDRSTVYIKFQNNLEIKLCRKTDIEKGDDYFGPFTNNAQAKRVLNIARHIFKYCQNPEGGRACFYYHLDLCEGVCIGKISLNQYRKNLTLMKKFLNGQTRGLLIKIKNEIKSAVKSQNFEDAKKLKTKYEDILNTTQIQNKMDLLYEAPPETDRDLNSLKRLLDSIGIQSRLERIEIYDNATLNQVGTVGGMVVFNLGVPQKEDYRLFKIKNQDGDTGAMKEMIERRLTHREWPKPDLMILDGGKGQLSAVLDLVKNPPIALAKKEETLYYATENGFGEYVLPEGGAKKMMQKMRNEAHRFINSFHARKRRKELLK